MFALGGILRFAKCQNRSILLAPSQAQIYVLLIFINNTNDMGMSYTLPTSFYATEPTPLDAQINSSKNRKVLCSDNLNSF